MKQAIVTIIAVGLLGALLALSGCSQPETANTATTPTATPAAATPAPAAAQSGDLQQAVEKLEKALRELQDKNYRGALDWINGAHKEVTAVLNDSNTPALVKPNVETANTDLDKVKALVEKKDPTAEKSLNAALAEITKLAERLNAEAAKDKMGATKGAAEKTVPKKK